MKETWKNVVGYEGLYQVSDLGRVRSLDRVVSCRPRGTPNRKGKVLKPFASVSKYLRVTLCKNGTQKNQEIHRLVTHAFIGPCPEGLEVRHGVEGILDNTLKNLRYGTRSENMLDRERDGTAPSKPVRRSDGVEYPSQTAAAKDNGLKASHISAVCCQYTPPNGRKCSTAGGYGWDFI